MWSSQSIGTGSPKALDLIIGIKTASLCLLPNHYIINVLFTGIPFTEVYHVRVSTKKLQSILGAKNKQTKNKIPTWFEETKQASKPDSDIARILGLSDWELRPAMINMLRVLMEKVNMHEQMV